MSNGKTDADRQFPRMPHERDQSSDSQQGKPDEVMEKAYRDIEEGRQDTDRRGVHGYEKPENRVLHQKTKERTKERTPRRGG
ncbi:MAG TPA: hypothetical protein VGE10_03410 [Zeimonas sp.]